MATEDRKQTTGQGDPNPAADDPLDRLLGQLQGGGGAPQASANAERAGGAPAGGQPDLGALLGGLLGGGGTPASGENALGALLGGLGGPGAAPASGGADLGALLGGLLGGGAGQGAANPEDLVSALLGGGQSGGGALGSLLGGLLGGGGAPGSGVTASGGMSQALIQAALAFLMQALANPQRSGVGTTDVMTRLNDGTLNADYLRRSGLAAQFGQEANIDEDTAAQTLTAALRALGEQSG